jgi:hypothetical protein
VAATRSQIAQALLIQFELTYHKPVMMHEFSRSFGPGFASRAFHDAVLELGSRSVYPPWRAARCHSPRTELMGSATWKVKSRG